MKPLRPSTLHIQPTKVSTRSLASSAGRGLKYEITPRPTEGRFHVTREEEDTTEDFEDDMDILELEDEVSPPEYIQSRPGGSSVRKFIKISKTGPTWEYRGTETDTGRKVYRMQGVLEDAPVKRQERLIALESKRNSRSFDTVVLESPLKDKDMDSLDPTLSTPTGPDFDFSKLSTLASDLNGLMTQIATITGATVSPHNKNALIQAFESSLKNQHTLKPMEASCYTIGHELLELHVINALSSTYPHLPYEGLIQLTQSAGTREALSRALLSLKLEPYIQLVPATPFSKFEDPSSVCLDLAANTYTSLIGWLYLEKGFEFASQFLFKTLPMQRVTPEALRRLKLLDGIKNSKVELHKLLERLRFPLPTYEIEAVTEESKTSKGGYGNRFIAIAKSGHQIIGRGNANSKVRAEGRAAANALLLHWSKEESL